MRAMAKVPADRFAFDAAVPGRAAGRTEAVTVPAAVSAPSEHARVAVLIGLGAGGPGRGRGVVVLAGRARRRRAASAITALAVLPFEDSRATRTAPTSAQGMTEGLIADLAQIGSLKVISRSSGVDGRRERRSRSAELGEPSSASTPW